MPQEHREKAKIPRGESHGPEFATTVIPHVDTELERLLLQRVLPPACHRHRSFEIMCNVIRVCGVQSNGVEGQNLGGGDAQYAFVPPTPRVFGDGVPAYIFRFLQRMGCLMGRRVLMLICRALRDRWGRASGREEELRSLHAKNSGVIIRALLQKPQTPGLLLRRGAAPRLICPQRFLSELNAGRC